MAVIELKTRIEAPIDRCFDLARSIDFHVVTTSKTQERAVAGRTTGLISPGEVLTWRAKHFGLWQDLTVQVTAFGRPRYFRDAMTKSAFASMSHDHRFETLGASTVMSDRFSFASPLGP